MQHLQQIKILQEALIVERAAHKKTFDDAHPDIGMSLNDPYYRREAIAELIHEGLLPDSYK